MILKVRVNGDDTKVYHLVSWNAASFSTGLTLTIQGNNLSKVSADFAEITKLEVYQDDMLVATYSDIDTFDEITFLKNEYIPGEQRFSDALRIHLTKTDIISQVQRIDEQLNPVVNVDAMSLEEVKAWKIKQIGEVCRAEIYAGEQVTLSDGTTRNFSYNADDQANILNSSLIAFASKTLGFPLEYIPYHPDETECRLMPVADLINIYMILQLKLTRLTTKCNMLNCMIRDCRDKESVLTITWNTELTEEYQNRYNEIVTVSIEIAQAMAEAMTPETTEDVVDEETEE